MTNILTHIITILSPWIAVASALGFGGSWLKKHLPTLLTDAKKDLPVVVREVETVGGDIGKIFNWPGLEAAKAPLELQLRGKDSELQKAHTQQVAATVLNTFGKDLADLSKNEKGTAVQFVESELARFGIHVDVAAILHALDAAQSATDKLRSTDAYKNTKALDQSLAALKQVEEAPVATPEQPIPAQPTAVPAAQTAQAVPVQA